MVGLTDDPSNKEYGEGNYKASKKYNDATKKFVESGRVDEAARDAQPETEAEAIEMADAEAKGRRRAKEEDPALKRKQDPADRGASKDESDPRGTPVPDRSAEQPQTPKPGQDQE